MSGPMFSREAPRSAPGAGRGATGRDDANGGVQTRVDLRGARLLGDRTGLHALSLLPTRGTRQTPNPKSPERSAALRG